MYHEFTADHPNKNRFLEYDCKQLANLLWLRIKKEKREFEINGRYFNGNYFNKKENRFYPAVFKVQRLDGQSPNRLVCSVFCLSSGPLGGESFKPINDSCVFFGAELPVSILLDALGAKYHDFESVNSYHRLHASSEVSEAAKTLAQDKTRSAAKVAQLEPNFLAEVAALFETPRAAAEFLLTPAPALGGKTPAEVAHEWEGKARVEGIMQAIRVGGYYWDRPQ